MIDSIHVISNGLSAINYRLADMYPHTKEYDALEYLRNRVHNELIFLIKEFIKENASRYIQNEHELALTNEAMTEALENLEDMEKVLTNVRRFISAINTYFQISV